MLEPVRHCVSRLAGELRSWREFRRTRTPVVLLAFLGTAIAVILSSCGAGDGTDRDLAADAGAASDIDRPTSLGTADRSKAGQAFADAIEQELKASDRYAQWKVEDVEALTRRDILVVTGLADRSDPLSSQLASQICSHVRALGGERVRQIEIVSHRDTSVGETTCDR